MNKSTFKKRILDYLFVTSKQPILFQNMLQANKIHDDGLLVSSELLGFRLKTAKAYLVYIIIINLILLPLTGILHSLFLHINLHMLIVTTMILTWAFFALFTLFKEYLTEVITQYQIQKAWINHLPLFDYYAYSSKVASIYAQALDEGVLKTELERYIIDNIILD